MKTGIVMEGGAMRGMFSAGVLDVLMENGVTFDGAIGVSAGAGFGSNIKSGQVGRVLRYNLKYRRHPHYCSLLSLILTGNLYNASFCYHKLPEKLDPFDTEAFDSNPMEFYLVCTDIEAGKPVYKKIEKADHVFYEWVRASSSLPIAAKIVELDGLKLLDGGITDSIPVKYFESIGYEKNLVVLTQPRNFVKEPTPMMNVMEKLFKKYPKLVAAIKNRHNMYNETLEYIRKKEEKREIFVIQPEKPLDIKRTEHRKDKLLKTYMAGRDCAIKKLNELKLFLQY